MLAGWRFPKESPRKLADVWTKYQGFCYTSPFSYPCLAQKNTKHEGYEHRPMLLQPKQAACAFLAVWSGERNLWPAGRKKPLDATMQNSYYPAMKLTLRMHVLTSTRLLYRENNRYLMSQFSEHKRLYRRVTKI